MKQTLYHKGKTGETRIWSVWTEDDVILTEYGVLNGELQISRKIATPKNIGKKNETTPAQQALQEAQSLYQFKLDRKYSTSPEGAQEPLLLPMLAKEIDTKKVTFPAYIQPKLDGVRCLAFWKDGQVKLISRAGKEWTVPKHINEQVAQILPKDSMFDGELYIHGKSCQTITSYVKKWREVETPQVQYHIYDMPIHQGIEDQDFNTRYQNLCVCFMIAEEAGKKFDNLILVRTENVTSMEDVKTFETKMIEERYEGAIVRNSTGLYLFGYRSNDLLKVKTFKDAEFKVVSCRDGIGKFAGCVVFRCKNDLNDKEFECTIMASMEERARMFTEQASYIGKLLTVKFFDRTDDQLPRFPVGKMFRDEKDLTCIK